MKGRNHFEYLGVDRSKILKYMLKEKGGRALSGLIYLGIEVEDFCLCGNETAGDIKMWGCVE